MIEPASTFYCYTDSMFGMSQKTIFVVYAAALALIISAVYGFSRERVAIVEPRFVLLRNDVARLLQKISEIPDADLSALTGAEQRGEWEQAAEVATAFAKKNDAFVKLVSALVAETELLSAQSEYMSEVLLRQEARDAIALLKDGNSAMEEYAELRGSVFRRLAAYYKGRAAGSVAVDVVALQKDFPLLDKHMQAAARSYRAFNKAIAAFDAAAHLK